MNIFVNSKAPSLAYGPDGNFSEVDNALLFMCYAYYSDFWPSNFFSELRFLGSCGSKLVEWLLLLVFYFFISHIHFSKSNVIYIYQLEKGTNTDLRAKQVSDNGENCELFKICFLKDLKLY
jgi:hypothetical protein